MCLLVQHFLGSGGGGVLLRVEVEQCRGEEGEESRSCRLCRSYSFPPSHCNALSHLVLDSIGGQYREDHTVISLKCCTR